MYNMLYMCRHVCKHVADICIHLIRIRYKHVADAYGHGTDSDVLHVYIYHNGLRC